MCPYSRLVITVKITAITTTTTTDNTSSSIISTGIDDDSGDRRNVTEKLKKVMQRHRHVI